MRALLASLILMLALPGAAALAPAGGTPPGSAALKAKHADLAERLAASPFGKPLLLEATDDRQRVTGDAYAVLEYPFSRASGPLSDPGQWCQILLLPFNTKHCETSSDAPSALALTIHVGRKYTTPLEKTHRLDFRFAPAVRSTDYMRVELSAPDGPFGTRDYRIVLEMTPLDDRRSFMHFGYSYAYGALARTAMQAYLATIGANKVGFTQEDGRLVHGMRGVMERNTMRYLLAIESYLRAQSTAEAERPAKMVDDWFASVERYPRQLHELSRDEYVPMKLAEYERMRSTLSRAPRTASSSPSPS
jgi:hypothetical protein